MKRLLPAFIILICTTTMCFYSHLVITRTCNKTLLDINKFKSESISAKKLQTHWEKRKEKLSFWVNHAFLDDISIYVGQLTLDNNQNPNIACKNIETILSMIKKEQQLSAHSFY